MRRILSAAATLVLTAGALTMAGAGAAQAAETQAARGCPEGALCLYPQGAGWNDNKPSLVFESYGAHNLSNQVGAHRIFNNQTGGATARTCTGADGGGDCQGHLPENNYLDKDMTPINSVVLVKP